MSADKRSADEPRSKVERVVWQALADAARRGASAAGDPESSMDVRAGQLGLHAQLQDDLGLSSLQVLDAAQAIGDELLPRQQEVVPITDVRCVGDLCRVFEQAMGQTGAGDAAQEGNDAELDASLARAGKRRRRRGPRA